MLKASFLAVLLLGIYAAFAFGSIGHDEVALTAAAHLDLISSGGTHDTLVVNSAAKADRFPSVASSVQTTTVSIEPVKFAPVPADSKPRPRSQAGIGTLVQTRSHENNPSCSAHAKESPVVLRGCVMCTRYELIHKFSERQREFSSKRTSLIHALMNRRC
jgi:hypothetical protein